MSGSGPTVLQQCFQFYMGCSSLNPSQQPDCDLSALTLFLPERVSPDSPGIRVVLRGRGYNTTAQCMVLLYIVCLPVPPDRPSSCTQTVVQLDPTPKNMPLASAPDATIARDRDWTSVPSAALAVVSKHATTRTTPGGCRLARVCSGWRSAVRHSGPVVIKRGASIGASLPMCTSLSQWLGSNGAGVVCLQLQGLYSDEEGTATSTIISGLYRAASAAAAAGAHLQLQQLALDGNSLQPAMRLLPLLPHLQQLELTGIDLSVDPDKETSSAPTQEPHLQQLQEHQGITRLAIDFMVSPEFEGTRTYGSKVAALLLSAACPPQLQDLTLRWHPAASDFAAYTRCSIHVKQLAHLKQLRQLTLEQVKLRVPHAPEDAEVDAEVVGRLEQVWLLCPSVNSRKVQLDPEGLPALLPKLVELHATRPTFTDIEVLSAATNLTSIRVGATAYGEADDTQDGSTELLLDELASLSHLRKLVLPMVAPAQPYSMDMARGVTRLEQLQDLSLTVHPYLLGAVSGITKLQHLTSLSIQLLACSWPLEDPSTTPGGLWNDAALTRLTGLQHLAVQAGFLTAIPPAALEQWTALTMLTVDFYPPWQRLVLGPWDDLAVFTRPWQEQVTEVAAVLRSCPGLQQRLQMMYATGVVQPGATRHVYQALQQALPRAEVEVFTWYSVPGWLCAAA